MVKLEVDPWHRLDMIGRSWWGAEPPDPETTKPLPAPVSWVRFTYEDLRAGKDEITDGLQESQRRHMQQDHFQDIAYNFMVDTDGTVYEGRGWKVEAERPASFWGLEGKCLDICYIGDYNDKNTKLPQEQFLAGFYLMLYGLKENHISPQYRLIQFRDVTIPVYEWDHSAKPVNLINKTDGGSDCDKQS